MRHNISIIKKYGAMILAAVLALGSLTACSGSRDDRPLPSIAVRGSGKRGNGGKSAERKNTSEEKQLKIVTTIFPEYDWVREILGEKAGEAEITLLLDGGLDLHSYQPSAEDILKISDCDLFIYVGGESDGWVEDLLREPARRERKVINLLETLGSAVKEEELVEGMEAGHEHEEHSGEEHGKEEHGKEEHGEHGEEEYREEEHGEEEHEPEYDEHVWLSLKNAQIFCSAITEALAQLDPDSAALYRENGRNYGEKLAALDQACREMAEAAPRKTLLFGDRFPFRYLADDYGLSYYAAFAGCSAETEASFETVAFLAGKMDELGLERILTIEKSDQKLARTIIDNTCSGKQQILSLHSMQSVSAKEIAGGASYLSIMEDNLETLREALK